MSVPASAPDDRTVDVLELFDDPVLGGLVKQALSMNAGDRMPSERDLATQFAVSRPTLRDRLGRLESMGLVERRGGAGTFVKGLTPKAFTEILTVGMLASGMTLSSLQVVRVALERQAAREAVRAANPVKIAYMAAAVQRMERTEDPDELYAADLEFHRAMFDASESPSLIFFADVLSGVISRSVKERGDRISRLTHDTGVIRTLHRDLYEAIYRADVELADQRVMEHFAWLDSVDGRLAGSPGDSALH